MRIEPTPEIEIFANTDGGVTIKVVDHDICQENVVRIPAHLVHQVIEGLEEELAEILATMEEDRTNRPPSPLVFGQE